MANDVKIGVSADASQAEKELEDLGKTAANLGDKMAKAGKKLTVGVTVPLVAAGAAAFKMASDLSEATSQAQQVFGEGADEIIAAAQNMDDILSEAEFLTFAGNIGDIAQGMGFAKDEADDLAIGILSLGQDLASFKNLPTEQAINAITTALTGERESLKSLGIVINESDVQQRALAMGLAATTAELTKQDKAQATLALITEASGNAIGDLERTADGAANTTRRLQSNFKDTAAELGANLLPIGMQLLDWANSIVGVFSDMSPGMQQVTLAIAGIAAAMGPLLAVAGRLITVIRGLNTALVFLAANPAIAAAGILALGAGLVALSLRSDGAGRDISKLSSNVAGLDDKFKSLRSTLRETLGGFNQVTDETSESFAQLILDNEALGVSVLEAMNAIGLQGDELTRVLGRHEIAVQGATTEWEGYVNQLVISGQLTEEQGDALKGMGDQLVRSRRETDALEDSVGELSGSVDELAESWEELVDQLTDGLDVELAAEQLLIDIAGALDDLKGKTTLEVRQELSMFLDDLAEVMDQAGGTNAEIQNFLSLSILGLRRLATEGGLTGDELQEINDIIAVLNGRRIDVELAFRGLSGADRKFFSNFGTPQFGVPVGHTGGVFRTPGRPGGEGLALLQDGEQVIPRGGGGGSDVMTINNTIVMPNGRVLAQVVSEGNRNAGDQFETPS